MFNEIEDTLFPCIAAGIGGVIVQENLDIIECCQDADNLNIVYLTCTITGVHQYIPKVVFIWDSNEVDVSPFFIPNYKSAGESVFPIVTACSSRTVLLAYDVSSVIPEFKTIPTLTISVTFNGTVDQQAFSSIVQSSSVFVSSNPSATINLDKGLTPTPYRLYFDPTNNNLKVQYSNLGNVACLCAINCTAPDTSDFNLTVCKDEIQEINIQNNSIFGDPTNVDIVFTDAIGNTTNIKVHSVLNVKPAAPSAQLQSSPSRIEVGFWFVTVNGTPILSDKVHIQILRYENNEDNAQVWKDWTTISWKTRFDRDIRSGRKYGYAVRFKGEFGEISQLSDWTVVDVP